MECQVSSQGQGGRFFLFSSCLGVILHSFYARDENWAFTNWHCWTMWSDLDSATLVTREMHTLRGWKPPSQINPLELIELIELVAILLRYALIWLRQSVVSWLHSVHRLRREKQKCFHSELGHQSNCCWGGASFRVQLGGGFEVLVLTVFPKNIG